MVASPEQDALTPADLIRLDFIIEARRRGLRALAPNVEVEELAQSALRISALHDSTPQIDHDAIWARVDAAIDADAAETEPPPLLHPALTPHRERALSWGGIRSMFARFGPPVPTLAAAAIAVVALLVGPGLVQRKGEPAAERAAEPAAEPAALAATAERIDATVASAVADGELSVAEFVEIRLQVASLQLQQATPVEEGRAALAAATRQLELLLPLSDGEQLERVTSLLAVLQNLTSPSADPAGEAPADGDEAAIPAPVELPSGNAVGSDNASSSGNAVGNTNVGGSGNAGGNNGGSGSGKSGPKP